MKIAIAAPSLTLSRKRRRESLWPQDRDQREHPSGADRRPFRNPVPSPVYGEAGSASGGRGGMKIAIAAPSLTLSRKRRSESLWPQDRDQREHPSGADRRPFRNPVPSPVYGGGLGRGLLSVPINEREFPPGDLHD